MNNLKQLCLSGKKSVGTFCFVCSEYMVEACAMAGFDYVIIDNEHSPIDAETSANMIRAAEVNNLTPLCRVKEISRSSILKLLDVGAQGLVIPNVKTVEDVEKVVNFGKYPPIGQRGFSPSRKDGWAFKYDMTVEETMEYYNNDVLIIPQCETAEALDNIESIVAVNGVDGIFIGPYDLSIAIGVPGNFKSDTFQNAIRRVISACKSANKFCFMYAGSVENAKELFSLGIDSITYGTEVNIFISSGREIMKSLVSDR